MIDYAKDPNFKNKGKKGLRCNRTCCTNTEAYWYNRVTEAYYCQGCANLINESSVGDMNGRPPILSLLEADKLDWLEALDIRLGITEDDPMSILRRYKKKKTNNEDSSKQLELFKD